MVQIPADEDEKPVVWIGSALDDLKTFPEEVQDEIGVALSAAQFGRKAASAKPWHGEGAGIFEVVEDFRSDTYRAVYTVRFTEAVYVLHAFQKKSPHGVKTDRRDVALIRQRLAVAKQHHQQHYG